MSSDGRMTFVTGKKCWCVFPEKREVAEVTFLGCDGATAMVSRSSGIDSEILSVPSKNIYTQEALFVVLSALSE